MSNLRNRIEQGFKGFGESIYDHKFKALLLMLVVIVGFASQLPKIQLDTSSEGFLHESDPILTQYNQFRSLFGRDEMVMVSIKSPDIFAPDFLTKLQSLHRELEDNVPFFDDINSLINARNTRGEGDTLVVEDLFEDIPTDASELAKKKSLALDSNLYRNFILSEDGLFTSIMIRTSAYSGETASDDVLSGFEDTEIDVSKNKERKFLTDAENSQIVNVVHEIVKKYQSDDFEIYTAGSPAVVDAIKRSMQKDMQTFIKLALLTISIVLFLLFRRVSGVLLPLVVVILTLVSTVSTMAMTGTPFKLPTQILPLFLLAVGVAAAVHLMAIFYRSFNESGDKRLAIGYAMGHSGLAVFMTSLTTAAGLLSFSASEVAPIADLGVFASSGVMLSLLFTLILLPALIALFPIKHKQDESTLKRSQFMDAVLNNIAEISVNNSRKIIVISAILFVISLIGVLQIGFKHDPMRWLPESWDTRQATELLDVKMKGTGVLEVVVDTGKVNGLYEPEIMNALDNMHTKINKIVQGDLFVGKTVSVVDILKESNRALNENKEEFYAVPQNKDLIAQELFLFENSGSDDLEDFVDSQFSMARFTIKLPWLDAASTARFIEEVEKQFSEGFNNVNNVYVTGMGSLFTRTMDAAIESTKVSYLIAAGVISIMMIFMLGSVKLGLVSMIPNLLPIFVAMGFMGYMAMPLDMFTMLIGSISVGLVVDDTIHFLNSFRRYHLKFDDVDKAVRETMLSTGRAIMVTTLVLCLGFFIFTAASMENLIRFGMITGMTIILALLGDLFLAPALMKFMYEKKKQKDTLQSAATGA